MDSAVLIQAGEPPPAKQRRRAVTGDGCPLTVDVVAGVPVEVVGDGGDGAARTGACRPAFRTAVEAFIQQFGEPLHVAEPGLQCWRVVVDDAAGVEVLVYKEDLTEAVEDDRRRKGNLLAAMALSSHHSRPLHCDHCKVMGWGDHPVTAFRYHFIIPNPVHVAPVAAGCCPACQTAAPSSSPRAAPGSLVRACKPCGSSWLPACLSSSLSALECATHLLHGTLHGNGFGHLLRMNGREGGSPRLSGTQLMELWDRLCSTVRARQVSVEDVSRKLKPNGGACDYRLLHAAAFGAPWFARWGYTFGRGSYGITPRCFATAVDIVRAAPLQAILKDFEGVTDVVGSAGVSRTINTYVAYAAWGLRLEHPQTLATLGELLRYMMHLKDTAGNDVDTNIKLVQAASSSTTSSPTCSTTTTVTTSHNKPTTASGTAPCRWSAKRVELATRVVVDVLRVATKPLMTRQELRDGARQRIGDTGLLDHVLKSIGNRIVGDVAVRRAFNTRTKVLEYHLQDPTLFDPVEAAAATLHPSSSPAITTTTTTTSRPPIPALPSRDQVWRDMLLIYKYVLASYAPAFCTNVVVSHFSSIAEAARIILDTKHLMKDYRGDVPTPNNDDNNSSNSALISCSSSSSSNLTLSPHIPSHTLEAVHHVACTVMLDNNPRIAARRNVAPPSELISVSACATLGELKREAERAFRGVYPALRGLRVDAVVGLEALGDGEPAEWVLKAMKVGSGDPTCGPLLLSPPPVLVLRACGEDVDSPWRFEGEDADSWTVRCPCGARDDDGERMVCCDVCEVWQHTRCNGITEDSLAPPPQFVCSDCLVSLADMKPTCVTPFNDVDPLYAGIKPSIFDECQADIKPAIFDNNNYINNIDNNINFTNNTLLKPSLFDGGFLLN
eukprot:jgi/Chlat1/6081/Chrsp4S06352